MDKKAFFKLTYGLFVVGVEFEGQLNGCIINTASQATSEPGRLVATMLKTNLTTEMITKKGSMAISVLSIDCPLDKITHFGMQSGRNKEKFADIPFEKDGRGNPYIVDGTIARFSCRVEQTIDLGSHYLFICEVEDCLCTGQEEPITYADYRKMKSGGAPRKTETPADAAAPQAKQGKWVCSVCHYVYDGEIPFEELPADWRCPVCQRGKEVFVLEG